jgi:hypothetical protein
MLQAQIERFGDNILKNGTIIEGCNFQFNTPYPYVKIKDNDANTAVPIAPVALVNYFVTNQNNLQAVIVNSQDGFESTDPNMKTLYIHYRNAGNDSNTFAYTPGDTLTVTDPNHGIFSVIIQNGGLNFSNSDSVVFLPALAMNVSSGTFTNGEFIVNPITGANVQIVGYDDITLATKGQVILNVQPRNSDLTNASSNASFWSMAIGDSIKNASNTVVGTIEDVYGQLANASIVTDGTGRVANISIGNPGARYTIAPNARIKSANNNTGLAALSIVAINRLAQVTVANTANAVGNGYSFSITDGVIYQKGYFLHVPAQQVLVSKYSQQPNNVSVGFITQEAIIDSNEDQSLLDNATGWNNEFAPGADRLQLTPTLATVLTNTITPNTNMLPIVQFSEGNPFRLQSATQYSVINDAMAQRTFESQGNFAIDQFQVTTRSTLNAAFEGNSFSVVVDPGTSYVDGYRVQTVRNFVLDISKGLDTDTGNVVAIPLAYRNYVRINQIGGVFQFSTGDQVQLYDAPKTFLSNGTLWGTGNTTPQGNLIGTARIRSMTYESGIPGSANACYRLYLFNVNMSTGLNFSKVRSVYYNGTYKGIADILLELNPTTQLSDCEIHYPSYDTLLFPAGVTTLQNASNTTYIYRTIDQTATISNTGSIVKSLASVPNEFFPYLGALSITQMEDLYVVPLANLRASSNIAGLATINSTSNILTSNGNFITDLAVGDFLYLYDANNTANNVRQVITISNGSSIIMDGNGTISSNNLTVYRFFPKYVPIPFGVRNGYTATVDANSNILTCNLNMNLLGSTSINVAIGVNIERENVPAGTKIANRDQFVMLNIGNNAGGVNGPWCLGVPDIIRLKAVYLDSNSSVSNASANVVSQFYIDHNQNQDFLDLGWLMLVPGSSLKLTANNWLLVQFDCLTVSNSGYYTTTSYVTSNVAQMAATDSLPLANLGSSINTWEIPEVYDAQGTYYDLLNQFDFRPIAVNTAILTSNAAAATINPVVSLSFGNTANPANDRKFPLPDSTLDTIITEFEGRTDSVLLGKDGNVFIIKGIPSGRPKKTFVNSPQGSMLLNNLYIPPYPNKTAAVSNNLSAVLNMRIANEVFLKQRQNNHSISLTLTKVDIENDQPQVYTMKDIGALDRRIGQLEYYQSLSLLETDVNTRIIPSSVDPTQNRFKFGFYADDFSTQISQDVQNPQYNAALANTCLVPNSYVWTVTTSTNGVYSTSYIDWPIVNQPYATTNVVPCVCVAVVVVVNVVEWFFHRFICRDFFECGFRDDDDYDDFYESHEIEYGAGPCGLFFYTDYGFAKFRIFREGVLILDSTHAVDLDLTNQLDKKAHIDPTFEGLRYGEKLVIINGNFCSGHGKIILPVGIGPLTRLTVFISKGRNCRDVRWVKVGYPIASLVCTCPNPPPDVIVVVPVVRCITYIGIWDCRPCFLPCIFALLFGLFLLFLALIFCLLRAYYWTLRICGLRPFCRHEFYVEDCIRTPRCRNERGDIADGLFADEFGICEFRYYHEWDEDDIFATHHREFPHLRCELRAPFCSAPGVIILGSGIHSV